MSSAALRPGIALGTYPQREDIRDSWLERAAAGLSGFVHQHARGRRPRYWRFIEGVEAQARDLNRL